MGKKVSNLRGGERNTRAAHLRRRLHCNVLGILRSRAQNRFAQLDFSVTISEADVARVRLAVYFQKFEV